VSVGLLSKGGEGMAGRSRMNREAHVRICGGLEVRFLRSTRPADSSLGDAANGTVSYAPTDNGASLSWAPSCSFTTRFCPKN
jgi:hypothetical protein